MLGSIHPTRNSGMTTSHKEEPLFKDFSRNYYKNKLRSGNEGYFKNYIKIKTNPCLIFSDFKFYSEAGLGDTSK